MNPLLKKILIIVGILVAAVAIGALSIVGYQCSKKWEKKHERRGEYSRGCKSCSADKEDEDGEDDGDSRGRMMKRHDGRESDMPMMKKGDKKD